MSTRLKYELDRMTNYGDEREEAGRRGVLEALVSPEVIGAVAAAQYAAEREIPVDPELYANRLVQDEYTKFAEIGLRAAVDALTRKPQNGEGR